MHRVLVLGVPRGGTTWVGQTFGRTAGAAYVHEPDGTGDAFAFRAKLHLLHHPILEPDDAAPEFERLWAGAFAGGAFARSWRGRVAQRLYLGVKVPQKVAAREHGRFTPRLKVATVAAVPRAAVDAERVVVKSVNASLCAEWITRRFDPRVVVVSRDLRNVLASWLSFGWNPPRGPMYDALRGLARSRWGAELPRRDAPDLERATATVGTLTASLLEALRRNPDWVHVSHEDLCADSVPRLRAAAEAVGLRWTPEAERFVVESDRPGKRYQTNRVAGDLPERWRERLTTEQVATITSVLDRFPPHLRAAVPPDPDGTAARSPTTA